jgi:hypothetical protein
LINHPLATLSEPCSLARKGATLLKDTLPGVLKHVVGLVAVRRERTLEDEV